MSSPGRRVVASKPLVAVESAPFPVSFPLLIADNYRPGLPVARAKCAALRSPFGSPARRDSDQADRVVTIASIVTTFLPS